LVPNQTDSPRQALLVKNWEIVQGIIKTLGERSWKIKAWGVTVWWAVIGYATSSDRLDLVFYLLTFIAIVFVIDGSVRLIEEKFLERTHEIEKALSALAAGDIESLNISEISTNVQLPTTDLGSLLTLRRFSFWLPYLSLAILTLIVLLIELARRP